MRKAITSICILVAITVLIACQKDNSASPQSLKATKTSAIKKGEPIIFTAASLTGSVNWSVSPSTRVQVNPSGNRASILFGWPGQYLIRASAGSAMMTCTVNVTDSSFYVPGTGGAGNGVDTSRNPAGPTTYTTVPLTGDQVSILVSRVDTGNYAGLVFHATTGKAYNCLNNILAAELTQNGNDITISFSGVKTPDGAHCESGQSKPSSFHYVWPVGDGSHSFKVVLNGTTYSGTVVKSGKNFTITWPYANGVSISPLSL